jgi:hypothetical protein
MVVPTEQAWRYTTDNPGNNWAEASFDASGWKEGRAGFGTDPPGFIRHTDWKSPDIWLRREIAIPEGEHPNLQLVVYHDEDAEIYVDGVLAAEESGFTTSYTPLGISSQARALMKPGAKLTIAVHCHQTIGGQGIDVGLADVKE